MNIRRILQIGGIAMQKVLFMSFFILFIDGCYEGRKWNNPADPNASKEETKDTKTSSKTSGTSSSGETTTDPQTAIGTPDEGSTDTGVACLTGNCNPHAGTEFNFSEVFSVTPSGCSSVSEVRFFDNGSEIISFVGANCGERRHVYAVRTSYSGEPIGTPTTLTSDCTGTTTGVSTFSVDKGSSGYLLAYECKTTASSYVTKVVPVSTSGTPGTASTYETLSSSTSDRYYTMIWNSTAGVYGLARNGKFQRFNETGFAVGGPVAIADTTFWQLTVVNDSWFILQQADDGWWTQICSKISKVGNLQFNATKIDGRNILSANDYLSVDGFGRVVIFDAGSQEFSIADLDPDLCTISNRSKAYPLSSRISDVFNPKNVTSTTSSIIAKMQNKSLVMATYPGTETFSILGESSITGFNSVLNDATISIIDGKIYVGFDKDGNGYISYSNDPIQ